MSRMRVMRLPFFLWAGVFCVGMSRPVLAVDRIWDQPTFGIFEFGSSWQGGVVPGPNDTAVFGATPTVSFAPVTVQFEFGANVGGMTVESGDYTLIAVTNNLSFNVSGAVDVGTRRSAQGPDLSSTADLTFDFSGGLTMGSVTIGIDRGFGPRDGNVSVTRFTQLFSSDLFIGRSADATGEATVRNSNASWNVTNGAFVGQAGTGFLDVVQSGRLLADSMEVATELTGSGTVNVNGQGSRIETEKSVEVGVRSEGNMFVTRGGMVTTNTFARLGTTAPAIGNVVVNGSGTSWTVQNSMEVGASGTGTLTVAGGGVVAAETANTGTSPGGEGTIIVTGPGSTFVTELQLWTGLGGDGELRVEDEGTVNTNTWARLAELGAATGLAFVDGAGSDWNINQTLDVGYRGHGELSITNGGRVFANSADTGTQIGSNGLIAVIGDDSSFETETELRIGNRGVGDLQIADGGLVETNAFARIGEATTSFGTADVTGTGSRWNISDSWAVGWQGPAIATFNDGGFVSANDLTIARFDDSFGSLEFNSASASISTFINVGANSAGEMNLYDGSSVNNDGFSRIGGSQQADGSVIVSNSTWDMAGFFQIGWQGAGALDINQGGHVSCDWVRVAEFEGSNGFVSVDGTGSSLQAAGFLNVGNKDIGSMFITDGGNVTANNSVIGNDQTGIGEIYVSGKGAKLSLTNQLRVGGRGDGLLDIRNGGQVSNTWCRVGESAGGLGDVTVSGPSSSWINTDFVDVGPNGVGKVHLENGGRISSPNFRINKFGLVDGDGKIEAPVINLGLFAAGTQGGVEITGDYTQAADGSMLITIDDSSSLAASSLLRVEGTAFLGGTLEIDFEEGFTPSPGTTYTVMTFASRVGKFAAFDCVGFENDDVLSIKYTKTSVELVVVEPCGPTCYDLSADCDGDGIVDACQISDCPGEDPSCQDCNNNLIPDSCDLEAGTSSDTDSNGVPDECVGWDGGGKTNRWSDAANWDDDTVPNNTVEQTFAADVSGIETSIILDIEAGVDAVRLLSGARLSVSAGSLRLDEAAGIRNDGSLAIRSGRSIVAAAPSPVRLLGTSPFRLDGATARLTGIESDNAFLNLGRVEGKGIIDSAFLNASTATVEANSPGSTLLITGPGRKVNNGFFRAVDGATLHIGNTSVSGSGRLQASRGTILIGPLEGPTTAGGSDGSTVTVSANSAQASNGGNLYADGDAETFLSGTLTIDNCGTYQAAPLSDGVSASLSVNAVVVAESIPGSGGSVLLTQSMDLSVTNAVELQGGGLLQLLGGCTPPRLEMSQNSSMSAGSLNIAGNAYVEVVDNADANIGGDVAMLEAVGCDGTNLGGCTPPRLTVVAQASMTVGGDLTLPNSANVTVGNNPDEGTTMSLAGDFVNESTTPETFQWLNGTLILDGEDQRFETAGRDVGAVPDGLINNFAIGRLEVASNTTVTFSDMFDNDRLGQSPCTEALYVNELVLAPNAMIILNETTIYAGTVINNGGTLQTDGACGRLARICEGDFDGDCTVTLSDFDDFQNCVSGPGNVALSEGCAVADFDLDGDVDFVDFGRYQSSSRMPEN